MTAFNHVNDPLIRSVLEGDISEDALCYALNETLRHARADQAMDTDAEILDTMSHDTRADHVRQHKMILDALHR